MEMLKDRQTLSLKYWYRYLCTQCTAVYTSNLQLSVHLHLATQPILISNELNFLYISPFNSLARISVVELWGRWFKTYSESLLWKMKVSFGTFHMSNMQYLNNLKGQTEIALSYNSSKVRVKKSRRALNLAANKKSTILIQSSWSFSNMKYSWDDLFMLVYFFYPCFK